MPEPLLILEDIHASYLKKETLRGVSLAVGRGEVVALLGGNGSGKSTTLKVIAGLLPPSKGRVWFEGKDITHATPHQRQVMGIGYLLQGGRVFPNLTVVENFEIALAHARDGVRTEDQPTVGSIFPELKGLANSRAGLLSGGQRQMLAIEMVFGQRPRLTLLDEPTGALAEALATSFLRKIKTATQQSSHGILLVEQNAATENLEALRRLVLKNGVVDINNNQANNQCRT